jgi:ethanolamine ammonia-lyase large subunit
LFVRKLLGLKPAPEFETWLLQMGLMDAAGKSMNPLGKQALLNYLPNE